MIFLIIVAVIGATVMTAIVLWIIFELCSISCDYWFQLFKQGAYAPREKCICDICEKTEYFEEIEIEASPTVLNPETFLPARQFKVKLVYPAMDNARMSSEEIKKAQALHLAKKILEIGVAIPH